MARPLSRVTKLLIAVVVLTAAAYLARSVWLRALGYALVRDDGPAKADLAVVLAGDYWGTRIDKAADLIRQGYVPAAMVDGPRYYGVYESTIAIQYELAKGRPAAWFIDFPVQANSTQEEAKLVLPELRRRNVSSYLLVTSDFHSGRAARIFQATQRALHYDAQMRVVVSHGPEFNADNWWLTRQGKKAAFMEWWKTVATAMGQ